MIGNLSTLKLEQDPRVKIKVGIFKNTNGLGAISMILNQTNQKKPEADFEGHMITPSK